MNTKLQTVNSKIKEIETELKNIESNFLARSRFKASEFPKLHVTLIRKNKWGNKFIGYCELKQGKYLLKRKEELEDELCDLNNQRDYLLSGLRYTLARKQYEKDIIEYEKRHQDYLKQLDTYLKTKEKLATETQHFNTGVKYTEEDKHIMDVLGDWGKNKRKDTWRFYAKDGWIWVERPKMFNIYRPTEPTKPQEPVQPLKIA
jgi:hypothetical protein